MRKRKARKQVQRHADVVKAVAKAKLGSAGRADWRRTALDRNA